jgi:hypothetical protein
MSICSFLRGAVAISVAFALVVQNGAALEVASGSKWSFSHLPRVMMPDFKSGNCGKQVPGYVTIAHASWNTSWHSKVDSFDECKQICDSNPDRCVGFEAHFPLHGRMRCKLYRGLRFAKDHIGLSFARCTKAMPCKDQPYHKGFYYSHAGTWKGGTEMEDLAGYEMTDCAHACKSKKSCVGFTIRGHGGPPGFEQCFHFLNEINRAGPAHDLRRHTYFKCIEGDLQNYKVAQRLLAEAEESNYTEDANSTEAMNFTEDANSTEGANSTENF